MIVPGGRDNLVAAPKTVLLCDVRADIRVTWVGEVTVRGAANEPGLA